MISTRSKVLALLEANKGIAISGAAIAKSLSISRSAVWKSIEELRKEGYDILAVTNKGYTLSEESDILSAEGLMTFLKNPLITADRLHVYKSIDSTNNAAKKMAVAGAGHGTVVLAEEQTAGRGRLGRSFFSPRGTGLYMSIILRPKSTAEDAVLTTTAAAVAVCRAVSKVLGIEASIKWVNDIYVDGFKVCGILTEALSDFQTGAVEALILGIGLNIATNRDSFPEEISKTAGSLLKNPDRVERNRLAAAILNEFMDLNDTFDRGAMLDEYKARSFILGEPITVYRGSEVFDATALDIDDKGRLIVMRENGAKEILLSGEVTTRPQKVFKEQSK